MVRSTLFSLASLLPAISAFVPSTVRPNANVLTPANQPASRSSIATALDMFTGIVEEMGSVVSLEERDDLVMWDGTTGKGTELTVKGDVVMEGAYLGCSIAVNGVCLTATTLSPDTSTFTVGLAPETLRKSNLGSLQAGSPLNLERASEIGGRNSGHFVQGHVDGTGTILDKWADEDSLFFKVGVDKDLIRYIVPKGFIAIDGTSLTVCEVDTKENWFTFMLVEYTQKKIIIPGKAVGDTLNIEVDVLGKYSESSMQAIIPRIEELEATVETLLKEVSQLKNGSGSGSAVNGDGGGRTPSTGTVNSAWAKAAGRDPAIPIRGSTYTLAQPKSGGTVDNWKLLPNNSITGIAKDNDAIADGEDITTAVIANPEAAAEGASVQTRSGILYTLGKPKATTVETADAEEAEAKEAAASATEEAPVVPKRTIQVIGTSYTSDSELGRQKW